MSGAGRRGRGVVLAVMAAVVVLLGAALGAVTNIGTGMLPDWRWVHSPAVIWSVVATSVLLLMVLGPVFKGFKGVG